VVINILGEPDEEKIGNDEEEIEALYFSYTEVNKESENTKSNKHVISKKFKFFNFVKVFYHS
jgi:NADH pyrophosphatase NudC (nudix superfamily)